QSVGRGGERVGRRGGNLDLVGGEQRVVEACGHPRAGQRGAAQEEDAVGGGREHPRARGARGGAADRGGGRGGGGRLAVPAVGVQAQDGAAGAVGDRGRAQRGVARDGEERAGAGRGGVAHQPLVGRQRGAGVGRGGERGAGRARVERGRLVRVVGIGE